MCRETIHLTNLPPEKLKAEAYASASFFGQSPGEFE